MNETHFRKLENMYLQANFNTKIYHTTTAHFSEGVAEVSMEVSDKYFHALGAIHGSVYFRMLDDAAFFAVNSLVEDVFVLTVSFQVQLLRPVSQGRVRSVGRAKYTSKSLFIGEATMYNEEGKEVAYGNGHFMKSKVALSEEIGYKLP